ncbi:RNA polymerase sigma factor [Pseudoalteromonas pernae]|uniref:RNA polymerase sigma factor n=1 Tax=Pseudoalteromonas pernae TaxID=3118054 RepID=UPI00324286A3
MLKAVASRLFAPLAPDVRQLSNEELALRAPDSAKAKEELVTRLSDDVLYFLIAQLKSVKFDSYSQRQCALDLLQEVWLTWLANPARFRVDAHSNFKAWLFSVARNKLIDLLRKQKPELAWEDADSFVQMRIDDDYAQQLIDQATSEHLAKAIQDLPYLQREALSLQLEGFSVQEIADITHTEKESIKTRLRYARGKIADAMHVGESQ